jgi:Domain of unknown function (DUF4145)
MSRRVLYGILLDKGCKLHPLHEAYRELIAKQRLPAMFDSWLPAITNDGHDAAHSDRALNVSAENIQEAMAYTSELRLAKSPALRVFTRSVVKPPCFHLGRGFRPLISSTASPVNSFDVLRDRGAILPSSFRDRWRLPVK